MKLIPVILCGGAGSRLWPISREQHPKPFIKLADGQSLFQKAFLRGASLPKVEEVLTVTNREFFFKIEDEIAEVNQAKLTTSFVIEPFGRNTAAAIAAAAFHVQQVHNDDALLAILPADHLISNQDDFQQAVSKACELAQMEKLVTFGVTPSYPNIAYGYIEADGHNILSFVEKPSLEKAKDYLACGRFLWNSGMFLFTAKAILDAMQTHCPGIFKSVDDCVKQSHYRKGKHFIALELEPKYFFEVPDNSIDYAVFEQASNTAVVPTDMDWSDMGSWKALEQLVEPDQNGNRIDGKALVHDAKNCYIKSDLRLIGAVGVENLLIIDTADALLVADKSRDQDVKCIYSQLKTQGHEAHRSHRTVHRPWGTYTILEEGRHFKIKRIEVKPGASLSLQMHHHRSEHWIVVSGMAKVINGEKEFYVRVNESTYIPAGYKHRLENPGLLNLVMIEVQSGDYLEEDDIVRFDDIYGRV